MMRIFIFLFSAAFLFACGPDGDRPAVNVAIPNTISTPAAAVPQIALSVPLLVGKTQEQVEAMLGKPHLIEKLNPTDSTGEISNDYKFAQGAGWINFKKGKANYFHFTANEEYKTFFPLGDLVGVNLRGVIPTRSNPAQVTYEDVVVNEIEFKEIRVNSDGRYRIITLRVNE